MKYKDMDELLSLAKPLVELLKSRYNPHCQIIIESDGVKVVEDVLRVPLETTDVHE